MNYAGFWRRFAAHLIDQIVVGIGVGVLSIPFVGTAAILTIAENLTERPEVAIAALASFLGFAVVAAAASLFYYAWFESSKWQATPGKMALGLFVADERGARVSLGRAFGRQLGKIASGAILNIGYIMVAFTQRKQGLHDILASTVVLKRQS